MRASLGDDDAANGSAASDARETLTRVHLVQILKAAAAPAGVDVIGYGRAAVLDRFGQKLTHGVNEHSGSCRAQAVCTAARVDACTEQRLVGIYVAHAGKHVLIQQDGFDRSTPLQGCNIVGVERVGSELRNPLGLRTPLDTAEHAAVVVQEHGIVQLENGAGVLGRFSVETKLPCHAEVNGQPAVIEFYDDELSMTADLLDAFAAERGSEVLTAVAGDAGIQNLYGNDVPPAQAWRQLANNCLHFRQFRHRS
jgi:hypothetical protein